MQQTDLVRGVCGERNNVWCISGQSYLRDRTDFVAAAAAAVGDYFWLLSVSRTYRTHSIFTSIIRWGWPTQSLCFLVHNGSVAATMPLWT